MNITAEKMMENYNTFLRRLELVCPTRYKEIKAMYDDLGEKVVIAPASSYAHFHNAWAGGYIDHVLRVMDYSLIVYKSYVDLGLNVSNFTKEELLFAAAHHDLGKMGGAGPGNELYEYNDSDWHRKNQFKEYSKNPNLQTFPIQDRSLFLLQYYNIKMSEQEYLGIRIHDGMYDEINKPYLLAFNLDGKLRSNLPLILHQADMMAARFEFERWATKNNFKF